jgi:non-canonical (house-cleaning) NTP pyrophosphatase
MRIALGSSRAAKIEAVRATAVRIASIDESWRDPIITALDVETDAPAMPLTDKDLMSGARARALAVQQLLSIDSKIADVYIGLEGGFHSVTLGGESLTFLKGWAYVNDGTRGNFGASHRL